MELVYAFTDEYGAFGWKLDNPTVSTHFIITAVIVKESDVSEYEEKAEAIRSKYFQTGEIKSQKVGANHERRLRILRVSFVRYYRMQSLNLRMVRCRNGNLKR